MFLCANTPAKAPAETVEKPSANVIAHDSVTSDDPIVLHFDGENSFPECSGCGHCCHLNVIAVSPEEVARMRWYAAANGVEPIDRGKTCCCFLGEDGHCMIWEARPQICRLYNCHVPRREVLRQNPSIVVDDDKPLIDIHDAFILGDASDPRYRSPSQQQPATSSTQRSA